MRLQYSFLFLPILALAASCTSPGGSGDADTDAPGEDTDTTVDTVPTDTDDTDDTDAACESACSADGHDVVDCHGEVLQTCSGADGCDPTTLTCADACAIAEATHAAVGCEYQAVDLENLTSSGCFAAVVVNAWSAPAHLTVTYQGGALSAEEFAYVPSGSGQTFTYTPYDATAGLAPGQAAVIFLARDPGPGVSCPRPEAVRGAMRTGTGVGDAFRIRSDVPVVAYQVNGYGGGGAVTPGASLLLATSAWGTNHVAVTAAPYEVANPTLDIVAARNGTTVTILPTVDVVGGGGVASGSANVPMTITLDAGQHAQISQAGDLTGSVVQADGPIGVFGAHACMQAPAGTPGCDHAEQMLPPVKALGSRYVGVMHPPRLVDETTTTWRLVGTVDGTQLAFTPAIAGAPATLGAGQSVQLVTGTPFVVSSQDASHPFLLFDTMSGGGALSDTSGYGDPDFVLGVPPEQWRTHVVVYADSTFPENELVVVRAKKDGAFADVTLDCAGALGGWTTLGDFAWTRVDLTTGNFAGVAGCGAGAHALHSDAPFGVWVWGWGTPLTTPPTSNVSYGYPGAMDAREINGVVIPPTPR